MADILGFLKAFKKAVVPSGKAEWKKAGTGALTAYAKSRTGGGGSRTSLYQAAGKAAGTQTKAYKSKLAEKAKKKKVEKETAKSSVFKMLMDLAQKNYERNA